MNYVMNYHYELCRDMRHELRHELVMNCVMTYVKNCAMTTMNYSYTTSTLPTMIFINPLPPSTAR